MFRIEGDEEREEKKRGKVVGIYTFHLRPSIRNVNLYINIRVHFNRISFKLLRLTPSLPPSKQSFFFVLNSRRLSKRIHKRKGSEERIGGGKCLMR